MTDRIARYKELLAEVAGKLRCAEDDARVAHTSMLLSMHEELQARHLQGEKVEVGDLFRLGEQLQVYLVPPQEPVRVELEIVKGTERIVIAPGEKTNAAFKRYRRDNPATIEFAENNPPAETLPATPAPVNLAASPAEACAPANNTPTAEDLDALKRRLRGDQSWKDQIGVADVAGDDPRSVRGERSPYRSNADQSLVWSGTAK